MTADSDARDLVLLYADRRRLTSEMAHSENPTVAMAEDVLAAGRALDEACQAFGREHYPRSGRVFVGQYAVLVASAAGRSRMVYDGFDEFAPKAQA